MFKWEKHLFDYACLYHAFYIMMLLTYFNITMKYARMSNHNYRRETGIHYLITGEAEGNVEREDGRDRIFA